MFRLKMILRLLQMPSFNNKMSALNEVNQIIGSVSQQYKPDWLTASAITVSYFILINFFNINVYILKLYYAFYRIGFGIIMCLI